MMILRKRLLGLRQERSEICFNLMDPQKASLIQDLITCKAPLKLATVH